MESGDWPQVHIEFADWPDAEHLAVEHLRPALTVAQADGLITGWFFIRKHPCWRLRYRLADDDTRPPFEPVLEGLAANGRIVGWAAGIYEPEVHAFGGAAGMRVAHDLFCRDSRRILDYLARQRSTAGATADLGRREIAVVLGSMLMRGAGQDWYEQGDVWPESPSTDQSGTPQCQPNG